MRAPPAAVWRVAPDQHWQAFGALLAALATGALGIWLCQQVMRHSPDAAPVGLGVGALVLCALLVSSGCVLAALWGWRSGAQPAGRLLWTGHQWRFQSDGASGSVSDEVLIDLMLDLGGWMLVRLQPCGTPKPSRRSVQWLSVRGPAQRHRGEGTQWVAFRAAVYFFDSRDHGAPAPQTSPLNDRRGF